MLFQWITKSQYDFVTHDHYQKIGTKIVGLLRNRARPYEVVLNKEELLYIRDNPDYLMKLIISLADKKKNE